MVASKPAKRYARALFQLARESDIAETVHGDLRALCALLAGSPDFRAFIHHPLIPSPQRREALDALLEGKAHPVTRGFLELLDEKSRLNLLEEIQSVFEALFCDHRGILRVRITSASPLEERQVEAIKERLKAKYAKEIEPAVDEDPSLIGGFQIRVGDTIFDHSIASRLQDFKRKLIHA